MLETSEKLELLELARDAAWVPDKGTTGTGCHDVDKWVSIYKTLRDIIDDSGGQKGQE